MEEAPSAPSGGNVREIYAQKPSEEKIIIKDKKSTASVWKMIFIIACTAVITFILSTLVFYYFVSEPEENLLPITSFEQCQLSEGSRTQESYPATCITKDGQSFIQPLPDAIDPIKDGSASGQPNQSYTCPSNGWVDCMPSPNTIKRECSPAAMNWYKDNCPNFQGGAM